MAFFSDTFTEPTTNTLLQSHTPDVGTSWTLLWDSGQGGLFTVNATTDRCGANTAINHGSIYTADATYPSANYEVEFTVIGLGGATDRPMYAFVRIQDQENMYAVRMTAVANGSQLYKKVSGSWTALGSTFTLTTGVITLGINGTTLYVKDDGTEVQSVEVSDISATGKAGLGIGGGAELVTSTDLSNNANIIDTLTVTDLGSGETPLNITIPSAATGDIVIV